MCGLETMNKQNDKQTDGRMNRQTDGQTVKSERPKNMSNYTFQLQTVITGVPNTQNTNSLH